MMKRSDFRVLIDLYLFSFFHSVCFCIISVHYTHLLVQSCHMVCLPGLILPIVHGMAPGGIIRYVQHAVQNHI